MILDCSNNLLVGLPPSLPVGLKTIYCYKNKISSLPTLPTALTYFNCGNNLITDLPPTLPSGLWTLVCARNPNLFCLPILPQNLRELYVSPENVKCIRNAIRTLRVYDAMSEPISLPVCNATTCVPLGGADTEGGLTLRASNGNANQLSILSVFPNPVDKQLQIEFTTTAEVATKISVIDILGRVVASQNMTATQGVNTLTIDFSGIPKGAYLLTVFDGQKQVVKQIVKN
jgi:Leucine-rich repeat (LRR) protein